MKDGSEDYKQLAKRFAELASECSASTVAEALRALALDYAMRAARIRKSETINSRRGRHRAGRRNRLSSGSQAPVRANRRASED
jgi:hypothetical protein